MSYLGYADKITAKYQRLYSADFPLATVMNPPKGWRVCWVRLARPTCPDAHWFLLLKKI